MSSHWAERLLNVFKIFIGSLDLFVNNRENKGLDKDYNVYNCSRLD